MPLLLLTSGCNTAIKNLSRFIEIIYSPLTKVMQELCFFTIHDPTIRDATMHDSCINYVFLRKGEKVEGLNG